MRTVWSIVMLIIGLLLGTSASFADPYPVKGPAAYQLIEDQYHIRLNPSTVPGTLMECLNQHLQPEPNFLTYSECAAAHPLFAVIIGRQAAGASEDIVKNKMVGYMVGQTAHDPYVCQQSQRVSELPPILEPTITDCSVKIYNSTPTDFKFAILMLHANKINTGYANIYVAVRNANPVQAPDVLPTLKNIAAHLTYTGG